MFNSSLKMRSYEFLTRGEMLMPRSSCRRHDDTIIPMTIKTPTLQLVRRTHREINRLAIARGGYPTNDAKLHLHYGIGVGVFFFALARFPFLARLLQLSTLCRSTPGCAGFGNSTFLSLMSQLRLSL